eukprot:3842577-Prymnesium_polylepis.2
MRSAMRRCRAALGGGGRRVRARRASRAAMHACVRALLMSKITCSLPPSLRRPRSRSSSNASC